jgi:tetratricopeptide (TPR) repeat protein
MASPFLSSEEYDERAHQLYNEGQYDQALDVLREGLRLYPNAVELHVGVGYARLAREEYAWARRSFEQALVLEPEHEDGLAGLGETLLKLGLLEAAVRCFRRTLELGYSDDIDLMLQIGRALFREGSQREAPDLFELSIEFFDVAVQNAPEMAEAVACIGYSQHRLGKDDDAIATLRRALQLDGDHVEARIYLANILYDRSEYEGALYHFERTTPEDHWDELGIWRLIELKRAMHKVEDDDPELKVWDDRLTELTGDLDSIDELLAEVDASAAQQEEGSRGQLELFGTLLSGLAGQKEEELHPGHRVLTRDGREYEGSWAEIVQGMRDADVHERGRSVEEFMRRAATRGYSETGIRIPSHDPELFVRGFADAGLVTIVR